MKPLKLLLAISCAGLALSTAIPAHAMTVTTSDKTCTLNYTEAEKATSERLVDELSVKIKEDYANRIRAALIASKYFSDKDLVSVEDYDPGIPVNLFTGQSLSLNQLENIGSPAYFFGKTEALTGYNQYKYQNWIRYLAVSSVEAGIEDSSRSIIADSQSNAQQAVLRVIDQNMLNYISSFWEQYAESAVYGVNSCLTKLGSSVSYSDTSFTRASTDSAQNDIIRKVARWSSQSGGPIGSSWIH